MDISHIRDTRTGKYAKMPKVGQTVVAGEEGGVVWTGVEWSVCVCVCTVPSIINREMCYIFHHVALFVATAAFLTHIQTQPEPLSNADKQAGRQAGRQTHTQTCTRTAQKPNPK